MPLAGPDLTLLEHANTLARRHDTGEDLLKASVIGSEALFVGVLVVLVVLAACGVLLHCDPSSGPQCPVASSTRTISALP